MSLWSQKNIIHNLTDNNYSLKDFFACIPWFFWNFFPIFNSFIFLKLPIIILHTPIFPTIIVIYVSVPQHFLHTILLFFVMIFCFLAFLLVSLCFSSCFYFFLCLISHIASIYILTLQFTNFSYYLLLKWLLFHSKVFPNCFFVFSPEIYSL